MEEGITSAYSAEQTLDRHVLAKIFSESELHTLEKFLAPFIHQFPELEASFREVYAHDADLSNILKSCLIVSNETLPKISSLSNHDWGIFDIVEQAIIKLVARPVKDPNVLSKGYQKTRKPEHTTQNSGGVESYFPNTIVNYLRGRVWQALLDLIGAELLFFVLVSTSLFVLLENRCYMQVCGIPLPDLIRTRTFNASVMIPTKAARKKEKSKQRDLKHDKHRINFREIPTPAGDDFKTQSSVNVPPSNKKKRLSMRQRKKLKSEREMTENTDQPLTQAEPILDDSPTATEQPKRADKPKQVNQQSNTAKPTNSGNPPYLFNRASIFYYNTHLKDFKREHFLGSLEPNDEDVGKLLKAMFYPVRTHLKQKDPPRAAPAKFPVRLWSMRPLMKKIISNFKETNFGLLLCRHCPVENVDSDRDSPEYLTQRVETKSKAELFAALVNNSSSYAEVSTFVISVCKEVIPEEIWGSKDIKKIVFKNIRQMIGLRRREKMSLEQVMLGIKISQMEWLMLQKKSQHVKTEGKETTQKKVFTSLSDWQRQSELAHLFFGWLFDDLIIPLIRFHFYCTESGHHRNRILYFRRRIWAKLFKLSIAELELQVYEKISENEAEDILQSRPFLYSFLRIIPKASGYRPILNFGRRPKNFEHAGSINTVLANAHSIMKFEQVNDPSLYGASVFNADDIYCRVAAFVRTLPKDKKLYLSAVDVKSSFDMIKQKKLLQILQRSFTQEDYFILKYMVVIRTDNKPCILFCRKVIQHGEFPQFSELAKEESQKRKQCVLVDQTVYSKEDQCSIQLLINELISKNLVKNGTTFYRQKVGIAQGSKLSSLLCSLFYADLEHNHFSKYPGAVSHSRPSVATQHTAADPEINTQAFPDSCSEEEADVGLMLRFIDDFLYATTSEDAAKSFVKDVERGYEDYGFIGNASKTKVNFDHDNKDENTCFHSESGDVFIPWCGYLINTKNFEFQIDYTRWSGTSLEDSLTMDNSYKPGVFLWSKMIKSISQRIHPLLLDLNINSLFTVRLNIYQFFLFSAIKFCLLTHRLQQKPEKNPKFFMNLICELVDYMHLSIQRKFKSPNAVKMKSRCTLTVLEIHWLGFRAFLAVLEKKHSKYPSLIKILRAKLKKDKYKECDKSLRTVTLKQFSSIFDDIKY
eukprot:TRINITY_DN7957_c0_g1_i2.p1 TRINITY_DN7957_c0_g1~~TRINITY_DN7957_c0_g1_i2.p1  ORF type:complete len:1151 (-),score=257.66 TRINITY_DN7957_c0_g1_i2:26-3478(-)